MTSKYLQIMDMSNLKANNATGAMNYQTQQMWLRFSRRKEYKRTKMKDFGSEDTSHWELKTEILDLGPLECVQASTELNLTTCKLFPNNDAITGSGEG